MAAMSAKATAYKEKLKAREDGFNMSELNRVKLNEYNSLHDPNMRHFFENRRVQSLLYKTGQIDRHGRVINLEKNKSKLHILEREFERAEKVEERRQREEMEMRYRVQRKRFNELERVRKEEILQKLKHDRDLSKEILTTMRSSTSGSIVGRDSLSRSQVSRGGTGGSGSLASAGGRVINSGGGGQSSFYITEAED